MPLKTLLDAIKPVDSAAYAACLSRFDQVAKPIGSLGQMETLLARIAAIQGSANIDIKKKCVLVFCADNGVVVEGVAQSDHSVTTAIARMMAIKKSCVCVMAQSCGAEVFPVDVGMRDTVEGLFPHKLSQGTENIVNGPAMSKALALKGIALGAELVRQRHDEGFNLIALGEAGIGNTTTASAMASVLLDKPVIEVTGRGAGLNDEGLNRKREAISRAIEKNKPNPKDPLDVLSKLGGLDIAAMTGAFLGGAAYGVPMVADGLICSVAALCATRLEPRVIDYILPSHLSAEPAGGMVYEALGLRPILCADLHLGEGTGAVALFPLLDMSAAAYHHAATFSDIAVDAYRRNEC